MSLDCYSFSTENGTTGFLGGIISAASDHFNEEMSSLGIKYETLDVDIFYIGENNVITFEEAIKKRMNNLQDYVSTEGDTNDINKLIESSHLEFKKISEMKLSEIILKMYMYEEGIDFKKISVLAKKFESNIKYYLQNPKAIYYLPSDNNSNIYEVNSIISRFYTYIIFDIALVEYDEFIILLVRGSIMNYCKFQFIC